jgi:hypothetical protein
MKVFNKISDNYFIFISFIQCKKNTEKDEYEIANLILKRNITAFGIKIFPQKKLYLAQ